MKTMLFIPVKLCDDLIAHFDRHLLDIRRFDRADAQFDAVELNAWEEIHERVLNELTPIVKGVAGQIRVHRFSHADYCHEHQDNAFPTSCTVVIRLDNAPERDRLYIGGKPAQEYRGMGHIIEPMQKHEITTGHNFYRYTLVAWFDQKSD